MSAAASPRFSVVIPSFDGRPMLAACLEGLRGQSVPRGEIEVIVVDNGSTDGTSEWLLETCPEVSVVRLEENAGFAEANNRGAEAARGEWLVLLNNDAVPAPRFLEALAATAAERAAPVVGGRILDAGGEAVEFGGGDLGVFGFGFQRSSWQPGFREHADGAELPFACGGAMLVRRDLFRSLGGFDRDYFAYYEDVDLGWRLWLSGERIVYAAQAEVRHLRHGTGRRFSERWRHFHWYKNGLQTLVKNVEDRFLPRLFPVALALLNSRVQAFYDEAVAAADVRGEGEARRRLEIAIGAAEGISWVLSHLDRVLEKRRAVQEGRRVGDRLLSEKFGLRLDFGPEALSWPENGLALQLLQLFDVSGLLQAGQLDAAITARLRDLRGEPAAASALGLVAERERLAHDLACLRASWSWRLTAPLRWLGDAARGAMR
jgi:GT2 family glycosyltransferase